ncbi:unnamed protein product [Lampetra fluviatilis]
MNQVGGHAMRPHCGSKTGPAYASQWGSGLATWGGGGYQLPRLHHAAHSPCLPSHTAYTYALAKWKVLPGADGSDVAVMLCCFRRPA